MSFVGLAQADANGNVNVSKFGNSIPGCGGFIDITQIAKEVIFCSTFTAGGLRVDIDGGELRILQEGRAKKFVSEVEQITFSGNYARQHDQRVVYVTERAIFRLEKDGLKLIEIAPGIDLEEHILAQMDFKPKITKPPKTMDKRIFEPYDMRLREERKWRHE